jgi:two-component system chemotaxis response regulator CheY
LSLLDLPTRSASPVANQPNVRPTDVLVVDDDYVIRSCVADTLSMEGYSVASAANGQLALAILQRMRAEGLPPPGVILLDMRMPVMDGWQFAEAYRLTPGPHAPIAVVTAAHDADKRGAAVGAEVVLEKPFDIDRLIEIVQTCAHRSGEQPG